MRNIKLNKLASHLRKIGIATTLLFMAMTGTANALEFQCELPGDTRYLKVVIPAEERLCEVTVHYENTDETKVLWHAQNDSNFCYEKAHELREKYENTWSYTCSAWPDRDGVDKLSSSQRVLLDRQLKALIERGKQTSEPFEVTGIKAVASTSQNDAAGLLALQFFIDSGTDYTEIIMDDGKSWKLIATLQSLTAQIDSDSPLSSAFIHTISDTGALEIHTTVAEDPQQACLGSQVLSITADGNISAKTPHLHVCHQASAQASATGQ
jgi:hypothetical protein